jgi:hypothetical protein
MAVVEDLLTEEDWDVDDVSTKYLGYDIYARRGSEQRHVEVKGTTGQGDSVLLTKGEVRHANEHKEHAVLAVVRKIQLVRSKDSWSAVGGECRILEPWQLHAGALEPVGYEWVTPPNPSN